MKYIAYTDGFYDMNDLVGASAVVILDQDQEKILYQWAKARKCKYNPEKKQRVNEQEMGAAIRAVMSVPKGSRLVIYSDSQYVVNVLGGMWEAKSNLDLIERYFSEIQERKVSCTLIWVKGHNGDKYNEMADELCNRIANDFRNGKPAIYETKNNC